MSVYYPPGAQRGGLRSRSIHASRHHALWHGAVRVHATGLERGELHAVGLHHPDLSVCRVGTLANDPA